jgi:hypothetical protein
MCHTAIEKTGQVHQNIYMSDEEIVDIENALRIIDEDYIKCFKIIRQIFDYLETFGLKDFNRNSKYKWSYDRDKSKRFSYVCIRYGSSLTKKCLVKRRAYIEDADLYKWVGNKDLIREALDEAYQYIYLKVSTAKSKIEDMKEIAEDYQEKLDNLSGDYEEKFGTKELRGEPFPGIPGR